MTIKRILLLVVVLLSVGFIWFRTRLISLPPYEKVFVKEVRSESVDGHMTYQLVTTGASGAPSGFLSASEPLAQKARKGDAVRKVVERDQDGGVSNLYAFESRFLVVDLVTLAALLSGLAALVLLVRPARRA